jgi:hypothetical protein
MKKQRRWYLSAGIVLVLLISVSGWMIFRQSDAPREAPEAQKVLDTQANLPFQILIPAYMPKSFDREKAEIKVSEAGPGGEPMVQLTYKTSNGGTLYLREWVPVNPKLEILAASRPIETKWGRGWLLSQGEDLAALWVDIGPLRVSVYSQSLDQIKKEEILMVADTLGPASNRQVFSFVVATSQVKELAPPPPVEIPVNAQGVQEVTLVVTPGGYSPLRFAVKKDIPVRLIFRQLGEVGCGNELNFPADPSSPASLQLKSPSDQQVLEFTPRQAGDFQFYCSHQMYRGVMTVR